MSGRRCALVIGVATFALLACSLTSSLDELSAGVRGDDSGDAEAGAGPEGGSGADGAFEADATRPCNDTMSDPLHCGRCGHSCLGDPCAAGACVPTIVAALDAGAFGIAVDDTTLYFAQEREGATPGKLLKAPKGGHGAATVLIELSGRGLSPRDVVLDPPYAVTTNDWSGSGAASVYRVPADGGLAQPFAQACDADGNGGLAVDATSVYYGTNNGNVMRAGKSSDCGQVLATGQPGLRQIAIDGTTVFFTNDEGTSHGLVSVPKAGGAATSLASESFTTAWGVLVDGTKLLVTTLDGRVLRMNKDGSNLEVIAAKQADPRGLATDSTKIYWASQTSGEIWSADKVGGGLALLAKGPAAQMVAVDVDRVYWTTSSGVMRVAK